MEKSFTYILLPALIVVVVAANGLGQVSKESDEVLLWHPHTISFDGPVTSEGADPNPFTDHRLLVTFKHQKATHRIRGYYAADGNAAETGADSGPVWCVKFAPDRPGTWTYSARLSRGEHIAIDDRPDAGEEIDLEHSDGSFRVVTHPDQANERDFRFRGRLTASDGYFRFGDDGPHCLKGGTNSPENLLAYEDFDGTSRRQAEARDGEAAPAGDLHRYAPHVADWQPGDPTWRDGRGKGLIGAINYLASTGMNAAYFLSFNVGGDGNDVWGGQRQDWVILVSGLPRGRK